MKCSVFVRESKRNISWCVLSGYSCAQITLGSLQTQRLTNGGEWRVADNDEVFAAYNQQDAMCLLNLHTGRSLTDSTIPDAVLIQFDLLMMSTVLLETCTGL